MIFHLVKFTLHKIYVTQNLLAYLFSLIAVTLKLINRGGVEDTRFEAKAKDTKKSEANAKDSLSRPRTRMLEAKAKDQRHSRKFSPKKKVFKKVFQAIGVARISDWRRPKPQITCNDVIKNLPVGT